MVLLFCILLFVLGFVIYRMYDQYIFHYLLIWICFGPILINFVYTITEEEYYKVITWALYTTYALSFLDIIKNGIGEKKQRIVIIGILSLIFYYVSLSFFRGTSFIESLKYITGNLGFLISLLILSNKECNVQSLLRLIKSIVYFELFLAFLQPFTDLLNFQAALNGDDVMTTMVNGSFIRNNVFIEFLTPLVMLFVYFDYRQTQKIKPQTGVVVLLLLYETSNSGVRTALVAVIPAFVYVIYSFLGYRFKTKKGRILAMLFGGICIFAVYSFVQRLAEENGITYTNNATDSSERQAVLLSMLNDADFAEDQTTLGLSFVVLSSFSENPLLGPGKLFQGNGYGDFINKNEGNVTDATLAIFLCETGVVGLLLLLFVYYVILNKIGLSHPFPKLVFIYLFIVTIADPGIFFMGSILLLFISITLVNANLEIEEDTGEYVYSEKLQSIE